MPVSARQTSPRATDLAALRDLPLAVIDVETTGTSVTGDRIIEIGVQRIERGRIVKTFESLLNPQERIPPFIEALTGITNDAVAGAPTFRAIHEELEAILAGCVFVAHNARFDYGFIRNECSRLGCAFTAACLCTVRLSRRLYPQAHGHSLSDLIERFRLTCKRRHRALDDANAVWTFLQLAERECGAARFGEAVAELLKSPTLPPRLPAENLRQLADGPGVYVFYDAVEQPLYVGKSRSVRSRVLSHFSGDRGSSKEMRLCQAVARVASHPTYGELGALLLEAHLIHTLSPLYNRQSRSGRELTVVRRVDGPQGYAALRIERQPTRELEPSEILGVFGSLAQAKAVVAELAAVHRLCPRALGLVRGRGSCLYRQLKQCRGACTGEERTALFNARLEAAFVSRRLRAWPYPGLVVVEEANPQRTEGHAFVIDQWRVVQAMRYDEGGTAAFLPPQTAFDYVVYKILAAHLLRHGRSVKPLRVPVGMRGRAAQTSGEGDWRFPESRQPSGPPHDVNLTPSWRSVDDGNQVVGEF